MKYSWFLLVLFIISCGDKSGTTISYAPPAQNCHVSGNVITCPDGSSTTLPVGTTITEVQFCPGTTTYPNQFNEIGFCISNQLYAVYSANNGFLTYVPPGYYYSNAIGSSCNFTVNSNCGISN